ncbi:MAG TPA: hypothetical protein PK413_06350 [Thermoanaerobaculia bacterium]|nr:hypothetical protein [Thermoanaerobaculia bacterium]
MTSTAATLAAPWAGLRLKPGFTISRFEGTPDERYLLEVGNTCYVLNPPMRELVLALEEGPKDLAELAAIVRRRTGEAVSVEVLEDVLAKRLPAGIFADQPDEVPRKPFFVSFQLLSSRVLEPITRRLHWLFHPALAVAAVLAFLAVEALVLPQAVRRVQGGLDFVELAVLYLAIIASGLIHELGHATACSRFGAPHGGVGFGLYLFFPAFYADVTKAWRLPPRERAVVDLGGLYFQCFLMIPVGLLAWKSGHPFLLHLVWLINFMMLMTLNPILKMDGYWLLSDLSGLRNLHRLFAQTVVYWFGRLRGKGQKMARLAEITGAKRWVLYAYSALALAYIGYLLPLGVAAVSGVVRNYPHKAQEVFSLLAAHFAQGEMAATLSSLGKLLNISVWPAILGFIVMRLSFKLFRLLFVRLRSAVQCLIKGLCHCHPAEQVSGTVAEKASNQQPIS